CGSYLSIESSGNKKASRERGQGELTRPRRGGSLRYRSSSSIALTVASGENRVTLREETRGRLHEDQSEGRRRGSGSELRPRAAHRGQDGAGAARAREVRDQLSAPGAELPAPVRPQAQATRGGLRARQRQRPHQAGRRGRRAEAVGRGARAEGH